MRAVVQSHGFTDIFLSLRSILHMFVLCILMQIIQGIHSKWLRMALIGYKIHPNIVQTCPCFQTKNKV